MWHLRFGLGRKTQMQGRLKGKRGHAHNAAVLLGLKEGVVNRDDEASEPDLCEVTPDSEG
jgi:hypothetical protein